MTTLANEDNKDLHDTAHLDRPNELEHGTKGQGIVEDTLAVDYVDPTLHITEEENKRLRKKIYKKYVSDM